MARRGASARERLIDAATEHSSPKNPDLAWQRTKLRRLLAAVVREELEAAAERAVMAAFKHSAGNRSTSTDFEYAIRAAILSRPRLTRARERKSR